MSLRSKLLIIYGLMLVIVLVILGAAHQTATRWRKTANELSRTYEQGISAERLHWDILRLIDEGFDLFGGDQRALDEIEDIREQIRVSLESLRVGVGEGPDAEVEADLILGFEEAYTELTWIVRRLGVAMTPHSPIDTTRWLGRLHEIDDEVSDALTVLEQYFQRHNRASLENAEETGRLAITMTGIAAGFGAGLLIAMVFLLRRWVTRPVAELGHVADLIGAGNLSVEVPRHPEGEWRKVADAMHHMTRSLARLQQQVRATERFGAIDEVAAYTAHNIRNPLASIRAMTQAAMGEVQTTGILKETLDDIIGCVDKMEEWIAGLLGYARPLALTLGPCDINSIVGEIAQLQEIVAAKKGIRVRFFAAEGLPVIPADATLLEQVFSVVISNSIDAGSAGGQIEVRTSFEATSDDDEWVTVTVHDDGTGISPELLPRVFEPFVSGKHRGSGLGLASAKKMVDLHLGTIDISSGPDQGTRVKIWLPAEGLEGTYGTDSDH